MTERLLIGQTLERAWWIKSEMDRPTGERWIKRALAEAAMEAGATLAPIQWETLEPGDERLPADRPERWRGARCLVGRCLVLAITRPLTPESFVASLERKDLDRLRSVTRVMHRRANPGHPPLSDSEADAMIEDIGPRVGAQMLADAVSRRIVN